MPQRAAARVKTLAARVKAIAARVKASADDIVDIIGASQTVMRERLEGQREDSESS
jgi:hypothetical protein